MDVAMLRRCVASPFAAHDLRGMVVERTLGVSADDDVAPDDDANRAPGADRQAGAAAAAEETVSAGAGGHGRGSAASNGAGAVAARSRVVAGRVAGVTGYRKKLVLEAAAAAAAVTAEVSVAARAPSRANGRRRKKHLAVRSSGGNGLGKDPRDPGVCRRRDHGAAKRFNAELDAAAANAAAANAAPSAFPGPGAAGYAAALKAARAERAAAMFGEREVKARKKRRKHRAVVLI
jgi:hypothetical protein